jgi:hypothetical protein
MKKQSFADFLKSNTAFSRLTDSEGDAIYNRLLAHVHKFALDARYERIMGLDVRLNVTGLNPRFWMADRIEDELSSWRPTISVSVPGNLPFFRFKFKDRFEANRAYAVLCASLESNSATSLGDLYRVVQDCTHYPEGASSIISREAVGLTRDDLRMMSEAADRVLNEKRKVPLSWATRLAALIPSVSIPEVDGSARSLSLVRRAFRQIRKGRANAALQTQLESFSGQRFESWIDALSTMLEVPA